jgi:hypothetical protein
VTTPFEVSEWMLSNLKKDGCIYQDDVVDYLERKKLYSLTRENADGNVVIGSAILKAFADLTGDSVVWVKPDRYWRFRVKEDEPGREARG